MKPVKPPQFTTQTGLLIEDGRIINHPRFQELHAWITDCLEATAEYGEPECLCLMGPTGVGKTTLVRSYAAAYPRYELQTGSRSPVLYLETPHPITVKGMTSVLLDGLGDPLAFRGTQPEMNARLQNILTDCEVRLVILDDFHHLIDKQTNRILRDASEWLKVLIKNTGIVYLVVGVEGEVERILNANKQLSRLFVREYMLPFRWQPDDPNNISDFARLISYVEMVLDVKLAEVEPRPVLPYRIHLATGGIMSNNMNLFRQARRLQKRIGQEGERLSMALLADAYSQRLQAHVGMDNPFRGLSQTLVPSPARNGLTPDTQ